MTDKPDQKARASQLRQRISKQRAAARRPEPVPDSGAPRPGESPNEYVERRMQETLKKKNTP